MGERGRGWLTFPRFIALVVIGFLAAMVFAGAQLAPYYEAAMRYLATGRKPCDFPRSRICPPERPAPTPGRSGSP